MHPSLMVHGHQETLELGLRSLEVEHQAPMYPLRNVKAGCLMHPPSKVIMNNCHSSLSLHLVDSWIKLNTEKIMSLDNMSVSISNLLYQNFWKNLYQKFGEANAKCDAIQTNISIPQLLMMQCLISHINNHNNQEYSIMLNNLKNTAHSLISSTACGVTLGWSWTRELFTVSVSVDGVAASLRGQGNMKPVPLFNGLCHKKLNRNVTLSSSGLSPGKALLDVSASKYFSATLQFPFKTLPHHVPTLISVNMGESFFLCDPKLMEVMQTGFQVLNMLNTKADLNDSKSLPSEDKSPTKSNREPAEPHTPTDITMLQSLTGTVIDIKVGVSNFYICDKSLSSVSGQNVSEAVIKAAKSKKEFHVINIHLTSINVSNANTKVDMSQYSQHPVLFPPAVWTAGKVNFPWNISLTGFSAGKLVDNFITEILQPVDTSCTVGSSVNDVSRSLAVHVDMSSVMFIINTSIMTSIAMVSQTLLAALVECLPPQSSSSSADMSPSKSRQRVSHTSGSQQHHLVQRSLGSVSEPSQVTRSVLSERSGARSDNDGDWSLWLQWAIPQCTVSLHTANTEAERRLNIQFEDTSASVDKQSSYTKFKFRVRSVTGELLASSSSAGAQGDFKPKNFPDQVISCQPNIIKTLYVYNPESGGVEILSDEDDVDVNNLSKGVFNLTITKAECQQMMKKMKNMKDSKFNSEIIPDHKRFLTEFDFEINPIDLFLETSILESLLTVLYPLACIKLPKLDNPKASSREALLQMNNNSLPMLYLKSERIRIFFQSPEPRQDDLVPNFILFQMTRARISSQVENPLSRILVNPGLYHQASNSRMLSVPGSPVEDRQYQVDISGVSVATGHWEDVVERNRRPVKPLLRTMSENPALEWNTNIQNNEETSEVVLVPVVFNVNIKTMFAPSIVYQSLVNNIVSESLVAGVSLEVNIMSDINLCLSVQQLSFLSLTQQEIISFFKFDHDIREKTPKHSDSGLESIREDESFKSVDNSYSDTELVPVELLVTCTNVRLLVHKYEKSSASVTVDDIRMWRRYHHAHRHSTRVTTVSEDGSDEESDDRQESNVLLEPAPTEILSSTGYDGSEDESVAENMLEMKIRLIPLVSVCITQPYSLVSVTSADQRLEISLYNMTLACSPQGFHLPAKSGKKVPWLR